MLARGAVKLHSPEQKKWLIVVACHAGFLADNRTPVGFVEIIYVIFQNKQNVCSATSTPSSQRMPLFDV